ncbi:hypothetical protein XELAEV_18006626mg [Xenopus laevis]|uniref:Uncharacterized protein n=1 Tax=Xenopus laevis TaxID=8355 RepID=A0A974I4C9_XENLA|nr:hypothetical protein XELAEV_18006626mg [Xenopus laevis]
MLRVSLELISIHQNVRVANSPPPALCSTEGMQRRQCTRKILGQQAPLAVHLPSLNSTHPPPTPSGA